MASPRDQLIKGYTTCHRTHGDAATNAGCFAPDLHGHHFAVQRNEPVAAPVVRLLNGSGPANVARSVVAFIVHALHGVIALWLRFWAKVLQQAFYAGEPGFSEAPPVTNLDPARTVIFISPVAWQMAARNGFPERRHLARWSAAFIVSMAGASLGCTFAPPAAAGNNESAPQIATKDLFLVSAIAATEPNRLPMPIYAGAQNGDEATKALTSNIEAAR